jgi:RNA polymerase subunit RPABC4/transcription elongation factor Spt4
LGAPAGGAIGGGVGFVAGIFAGIFKTAEKAKKQSSDRVPCQFCGRQISRADKYCEECGKEQALSPVACPTCNTKVNAHAKFCPNCGEAFSSTEKSPLPDVGSSSVADSQETTQDSTAGGVQEQVTRQNRGGVPAFGPVATARFALLGDFDDDLEEDKEEGRANSRPTGAEEG